MLFSVIVPVYNGEKYLPECLGSLAGQTWKDFETILVDDGSTDSSGKLVDDYAALHDDVRVMHGPNQGLLLARRKGLGVSQGQYVVFLDADDCLRDDALHTIADSIYSFKTDIVSYLMSKNPHYVPETNHGDGLPAGEYSGIEFQRVRCHVCAGRFNNLCGKAIKRSCFDLDADYAPYRGLMHGEDWFQLLPVINNSSSLVQLDEPLYYYRQNEDSSTARFRSSQLRDIVQVTSRLRYFAEQWGDECQESAKAGEALQYTYLLKLSELSDASKEEKQQNFSQICSVMQGEGVFGRARKANLRPDNRVLIHAMERGDLRLARLVVRAVEVAKR